MTQEFDWSFLPGFSRRDWRCSLLQKGAKERQVHKWCTRLTKYRSFRCIWTPRFALDSCNKACQHAYTHIRTHAQVIMQDRNPRVWHSHSYQGRCYLALCLYVESCCLFNYDIHSKLTQSTWEFSIFFLQESSPLRAWFSLSTVRYPLLRSIP